MGEKRWYNSSFGEGLGFAAFILALGVGGLAAAKAVSEVKRWSEEPAKQYQLQEADLNNNGVLDKFYSIDGKIALVELDGKPVSEFYKK